MTNNIYQHWVDLAFRWEKNPFSTTSHYRTLQGSLILYIDVVGDKVLINSDSIVNAAYTSSFRRVSPNQNICQRRETELMKQNLWLLS
jgi:hypothetical protein